MLLAAPRVLFPAAGTLYLGGGARTVGLLYAASAVGGIVAMVFSGPLGHVRRQGLAIITSIVGWGLGVACLGGPCCSARATWPRPVALGLALSAMFGAGAADSVSAVFRQTILQPATPDHLRGGSRACSSSSSRAAHGWATSSPAPLSSHLGEARTALVGGLACMAVIVAVGFWQRGFVHYDGRHPTP